jgi:hypothetical protein
MVQTDEILVERLMDRFTAKELREWRSHHDVSRKRGDSKRRTAERAADQRRDAVVALLADDIASDPRP